MIEAADAERGHNRIADRPAQAHRDSTSRRSGVRYDLEVLPGFAEPGRDPGACPAVTRVVIALGGNALLAQGRGRH